MEKMNDLRDLLQHEIEDLQSVEDQILEALPKMISKASNADLKNALSEHLKITGQHKSRLEKIIQNMNPANEGSAKKKGILGGIFGSGKQVCKGMKGIIEEGEKIMGSNISAEARDAAIIASAQKVEHYEICGYGTARTFARELGMEQIAKHLEKTLNEEYEADNLLSNLAMMGINQQAEANPSSASSTGRSAERVREKASREMEMEPVNSSRTRSSGRVTTATSKTNSNERSSQPKTSGSPRSESGRGSSSSKKAVSNERSSKTSGSRNERSSSTTRENIGKTNYRGRK